MSHPGMLPDDPLPRLLPRALVEKMALTYAVDANNQVRLPGSAVFTCLLHGLIHHQNLTLRLLEEIYTHKTGRHADHSSFAKRLATIAPAFFAALYAYLHKRLAPQMTAGEARALRVRFVDATIVSLSAKLLHFGLMNRTTNTDKPRRQVKSVVELREGGLPHLLKLCREPADKSDCVALGETMCQQTKPGDVWVFDKGCHDRSRLLRLHQGGSFFITPHSQQGLKTKRLVWEATSVPEEPAPEEPAPEEPAPEEPAPEEPAPEDGRFLLLRVEQAVFGNAQESTNEQRRWDTMPLLVLTGKRYDRRKKCWRTMTLMTNLALGEDVQHPGSFTQAGPYTFAEVCDLYRQRWEIEVLFKFLKQHLSYAHLVSRNENGIEVMLYMSLMAALLLIWYQRQTGIDRGWRSVKFWFAHDVEVWTRQALEGAFSQASAPPVPAPGRRKPQDK